MLTTPVHVAFSLGFVKKDQPIQKVLRYVASQGWNDVDAAKQFGVSKQVWNNWKTRGLPSARNVYAAGIIGCSVEELVGKAAPMVRDEARVVYGPRDHDAQMLAAEITRMAPETRAVLSTLIALLVGSQRRTERKKSKGKAESADHADTQ